MVSSSIGIAISGLVLVMPSLCNIDYKLERLRKTLWSPNSETRLKALEKIEVEDYPPEKLSAILIDSLNDKNYAIKDRVIWLLECIGPPAKNAIPDLIRLSKNPKYRQVSFNALETIGVDDPKYLPYFLVVLENPPKDPLGLDSSLQICSIIGKLGNKAITAKKVLLKKMNKDKHHQVYFAEAILRIDPSSFDPKAVKVVLDGLGDEAYSTRVKCIAIAGAGLLPKKEKLEVIKKSLNDKDPLNRVAACEVIAHNPKDFRQLLPGLKNKLISDLDLIPARVKAILAIDPWNKEAANLIRVFHYPIFLQDLRNPQSAIADKLFILDLFGFLGVQVPHAEKVLLEMRKEKNPIIQKAANEALERVKRIKKKRRTE